MNSELAILQLEVANLRERMRRELAPALEDEYRSAQMRCDAVAALFGGSAPKWLADEPLNDYRRRLLEPYRRFSPDWRTADLAHANESVLRLAERHVYSDAQREATHPTDVPAGQLVERAEKDSSGRLIRRFYGDPMACWGPFMSDFRYVRSVG